MLPATRDPVQTLPRSGQKRRAGGPRPPGPRCERDARTNTVTMLAVTCPSHEFLSDVPGRPGAIRSVAIQCPLLGPSHRKGLRFWRQPAA